MYVNTQYLYIYTHKDWKKNMDKNANTTVKKCKMIEGN